MPKCEELYFTKDELEVLDTVFSIFEDDLNGELTNRMSNLKQIMLSIRHEIDTALEKARQGENYGN